VPQNHCRGIFSTSTKENKGRAAREKEKGRRRSALGLGGTPKKELSRVPWRMQSGRKSHQRTTDFMFGRRSRFEGGGAKGTPLTNGGRAARSMGKTVEIQKKGARKSSRSGADEKAGKKNISITKLPNWTPRRPPLKVKTISQGEMPRSVLYLRNNGELQSRRKI